MNNLLWELTLTFANLSGFYPFFQGMNRKKKKKKIIIIKP